MKQVKKIDYAEYADLLNSQNSIGARREWLAFVRTQLGAEPFFLGFFAGEKLAAILPACALAGGLEAVPKNYTEPIYLAAPDPTGLAEAFSRYLKTNQAFKYCRFSLGGVETVLKLERPFRRVTHVLYTTEAGPEQILTSTVSHKTRNQIRAAYKRSGFSLGPEASLGEFYSLYQAAMRRLRSLAKNKKYFTNLKASFGENMRIISVYRAEQMIGANLVLLKNRLLHLAFSAAKADYFKDYLNDFLYWETIKFGLGRGINIFDFGPSTVSDQSHQHFKAGFGAVPVPIYDLIFYNSINERIKHLLANKFRNLRLRLKKII